MALQSHRWSPCYGQCLSQRSKTHEGSRAVSYRADYHADPGGYYRGWRPVSLRLFNLRWIFESGNSLPFPQGRRKPLICGAISSAERHHAGFRSEFPHIKELDSHEIASPWADRGGLGLKISRLTLIGGGSNSVRSLAQKIKSDRASRTLCKIHCTSLMTLTGIVFGHGPERLLVCRTMRLGKRDERPKSARIMVALCLPSKAMR
jgi:hypothetical protein